MKKMLFSLAFALLFVCGFSQNADSLTTVKEIDSLIQVSRALTGKQDFEKALKINVVAEKIAFEKIGRESTSYGKACFNHGRVLYFKGDYPEAEKWYLESKSIREKVLGKEHPDYVACLNNLAVLYLEMGNYEKAEPLFVETLAIREKVLGKEHPDYAWSLNNLAVLYYEIGNYEKAEQFYVEALAIQEKIIGKEHPEYTKSLNNLANLYADMGNYEKAEPIYIEALAIREKILGKEHPEYAANLTGLAVLYMNMGDYEKAEPLYLEALAIQEKALGKKHPEYASVLSNLAILYVYMGDYEKAEPLFVEALAIRGKALGKEHPDYAASLSNLALVYSKMGDYKKTEPLYFEALAIREKKVGKEHPEYAMGLNDLAVLYYRLGDFEKAEQFHVEALAIQEKSVGKEHPEYAKSLNNLANLYADMGNYEKAEPLYFEALAIRKKILDKEHPDYAKNLNDLAALYWSSRNFDAAQGYMSEAIEIEINLLLKASRHLSERELSQYLRTFTDRQNEEFSFAQIRGGITADCYDNTLFYKGFLLNAVSQVGKLALADSATAEKYYRFKYYHRRLAAEYANPIDERDSAGITKLEEKANALEKELARTVKGFGEALRQVNWQEVQAALKSDEAAIEFIHYAFVNPLPTDSTMYAALLFRPDWPQPLMVCLFEEKAILPLLNAVNASAVADQLYATRGRKKHDQTQKSEGIVVGIGETANLYQLIWQPLDSLMQGAKTIYFSPSGLLHRLNLGAVPIPGSKQILADRYQLVQVGSTRQLVVGSAGSSGSSTAALFGGLKYDTQTISNQDTATATATYDISSIRRSLGGRGGDAWNYLPGTEKEIRNIAKTLGKAGYTVQSSTGYDGTEASFKKLGTNNIPSPTVLHIATHGFFFPDPKDTVNRASFAVDREPVFKTSDNPLMRSGLILAGANQAWAGGKTPEGQEDGILTAYEISQMNLSATELVVLSACETGLGDVEDNEGVYGLQRAFKIAGAKYLIMSLWQVPDKETSEFMSSFYKKWLEAKMEIPEAFRAAQKEMRERGFDPYQWAGFVLVE